MSYSTEHRTAAAAPIHTAAQRNGSAQIDDQRASTAAHLQLKQKIDNTASVGASTATGQLMEDEDEPRQAKFADGGATQLAENEEVRPNNTGLPDNLKTGIENLSGMSMDHVQVHYNSAQPAQLNALAYAQGSDIHIAPGQERHLPHEAWHLVQQAQGRVKPTIQMKNGVPVNDNVELETEADVMGARALGAQQGNPVASSAGPKLATVQRKTRIDFSKIEDEDTRKKIEEHVAQARLARIAAKQKARLEWIPKTGSKEEIAAGDAIYNAAMVEARRQYGITILKLKDDYGLSEDHMVSGDDYYGTEQEGVRTKPGGKQYIKDSNGTYIPRYVRRELNEFDVDVLEKNEALEPTGISQHGKTAARQNQEGTWVSGKLYGDNKRKGEVLNFDDREFLQQSVGGGLNQFAFSHTSTKHPILSNDHKNFGAAPEPDPLVAEPQHARIVTDLSKIDQQDRRAQWSYAPEAEGGHKIPRNKDDFQLTWMQNRREKVIASGYRNMEVITKNIPHASVVAKEDGWEKPDESGEAQSQAGQWLEQFRTDNAGQL